MRPARCSSASPSPTAPWLRGARGRPISFNDTLAVDVSTSGPVDVVDHPDSDVDGVEPWALLRGLIDDFSVGQDGDVTTVSMSWPL